MDTKDTIDINVFFGYLFFCLFSRLFLCFLLFVLLGLLEAVSFTLPGVDELLHWWEQFFHSCLHLGDLPVQVGWQ